MINKLFSLWKRYQFLLEELIKRDFKKKYKRTVLGMLWSVLSPLLTLLVMRMVFTQFFGRDAPHYTTYLFAGNLVYNYFRESTTSGMMTLMANKGIIAKVNIPKYCFVMSSNVSSLINFGLTLVVFFAFVLFDGLPITPLFITLLYPILCLLIFNVGMGLFLSGLYVFFQDMTYLYNVFTMLLMYMSAIFYQVDKYDAAIQRVFLLNPVYVYIKYFRLVVIHGELPGPAYHLLMLGYAVAAMLIGCLMYKRNNRKFLYYM